MTFPNFYNPTTVGTLYEPDLQRAYAAGVQAFQKPVSADSPRVLLWLVDMQNDFILPPPLGRLSVPGAVEDARRTVEWIYQNVQHITHITASLDTHTPFQIFYPPWWRNANGENPAAYTVITADEVKRGVWTPTIDPEWSVEYVETLERDGKKQLMIWPFHCMEGTSGRSLLPAISEAIMFHSAARAAQPLYLTKGMIPNTEFYSVVEAEVKVPNHPESALNTRFLDLVAGYDLIYVAGEARSHCVLATLNSLMSYFVNRPEVIAKLRFLDDCTSPIAGFESATEQRIGEMAAAGMKIVKSEAAIG